MLKKLKNENERNKKLKEIYHINGLEDPLTLLIFPRLIDWYGVYQNSVRFFVSIDKFILKFIRKGTGPRKGKPICTFHKE